MKNFKLAIILFAVIVSFVPVAETKAQDVSVSVDFNTFQQELSPYGIWMNNPAYGQVWICNEPDFKPYYTNGNWEYTNYGWSWESDYDWGWAPFHYGRWEYDPYYGWMWIPGYEWASAWVSWSSYDDYYGWAPLGYGLSINISFGSIPYDRWNFIPRRSICEPQVARYCVPHNNNYNFRRAVVINNYYNSSGRGVGRYFRGPERREVERYTSRRVEERRINYNDGFRNRRNSSARNNDWNHNGRRNDQASNQNNNNNNGWGNRRRGDVNRNDAPASTGTPGNRWGGNRDNRPERRQPDVNNQNNTGQNGNFTRRRENPNWGNGNNNNTPPTVENRRPQRDANPQTSDNNNPGRRWNENRMNRGNQQNNYPQQQPQQRRFERPQMERSFPQQRSAPQMEQRRMERRGSDNGGGRSMQQRSDDNQRGGRFGGKRNS